jgi:hypothetical protein
MRRAMDQQYALTKRIAIVTVVGVVSVTTCLLNLPVVEYATDANELWLLLAPVIGPAFVFMVLRPVLCGIAVLGFAFVSPGFLPPLVEVGELSFRYVDAMCGILIFIIWIRTAIQRRTKVSAKFTELFVPLFPLLLYIGASLAIVHISTPYFFVTCLVSYLRLIITIAFAPMLYLALRDTHDVSILNKALIIFGIATIAVGICQAWFGLGGGEVEGLEGRFGGLLSVNTFGLVSGLLVLNAILRREAMSGSVNWIAPLVMGLLGLFLAKSASSAFATAGTITVYIVSRRSWRESRHSWLRWVAMGIVMTVVTALAVWALRPNEVEGLLNISGGSFAHRLMITDAGLRIFLAHPLVGVGWQASATEAVIGSYALNTALMDRFIQLPVHYFFLEKTTSLHNMYIQFLAELGIIGFALFIRAVFQVGKRVKAVVNNIPIDSPYKVWARFYALGLVFLLIWWNTNSLFGGQTESMLAFTFLGALASIAQPDKGKAEQRTNS